MNARNIAPLILASGSSTRFLNKNKLLMPFRGKLIIHHIVDQLLKLNMKPTLVIGYQANNIKKALSQYHLDYLENPTFSDGMGSSISVGIGNIISHHYDACLICLADMPFITSEHIEKLITSYENNSKYSICLPMFNNKIGHPVLFSRKHFNRLSALKGDQGGKMILKEYSNEILKVNIEDSAILHDIDFIEDYQRIL